MNMYNQRIGFFKTVSTILIKPDSLSSFGPRASAPGAGPRTQVPEPPSDQSVSTFWSSRYPLLVMGVCQFLFGR